MNTFSFWARSRSMRSLSAVTLATAAALALTGALLFLFNGSPVARAAGPFYVAPGGDDTGACDAALTPCATIQAAIGKATPGDTINVAAGTYTTTGVVSEVVHITQTLTLSGGWDALFMTRTGTSTIDAEDTPGRRGLTVDAGVVAAVDTFTIQRGNMFGDVGGGAAVSGTLTLSNVVVLNNTASLAGGGIANDGVLTVTNSTIMSNTATLLTIGSGGGIVNNGQLALADSAVVSNTASNDGGGLINSGTVTVTNSTIQGNTAGDDGGGLRNFGTLLVTLSTVSGNTSVHFGGGVDNGSTGPSGPGVLTVTQSLFSGNASTDLDGGGLYNENGTLTLTNTTVSTNTARGSGGGVYNLSTLTVDNATITDNTADGDANGTGDGGGLFHSAGTTSVKNTIIAGNTDAGSQAPDCSGAATSDGYNLIGDNSNCTGFVSSGDQVGTAGSPLDPQLGPLADNGGPTRSHALLAGSPAIDAADPGFCPAADQLGTTRPQGAQCDIGAIEKAVVAFSAAAYSVSEAGTSAAITVTLSNAAAYTVTVDYATGDGTATAGSDYTSLSGTLTFTPGVTSQTFNVAITDDALDEANETVVLTLSNEGNATIGGTNPATLTILDDDLPPTVQFDAASYSVNENVGAGTATITVTLSAVSGLTATVDYATSDGTATAGPSGDYTSLSGTLTFTPGVTSQTFNVAITDDTLDEANETVVLTLSNQNNATIAGTNPVALTILDDDPPPTVQFDAASYSVDENVGAGTATITVTLSALSGLTATVDFATSDGTATAGSDYTALSGTLTFTPGVTSQTFNVPITNDTTYEGDESLSLTLSNQNSNATLGTPNPATLTIVENDPQPVIAFSAAAYSVDEAGVSAAITVTLSGSTDVTATVNYATSDATAVTPGDYSSLSDTLTFTPGVNSQTINVPIVSDSIFEFDETFRVTLSGQISATLSGTNPVTVTILDDDTAPTIQLSSATYSVNENAGPAVITATLTGSTEITATVNYSTTNGTALAGSDYTGVTSALTFTPGVTSQTFNVPITDDNIYETNETFTVTLSTAVSATLVSPISAAVTITNDEALPSAQFLLNPFNVLENAGSALITVTLSHPSVFTATMNYATTANTATPGDDYTNVSGTLTFTAGVITQTFTVPILNETGEQIVEPDEFVTLTLSSAVSATLPLPTSALAIIDDDGLPSVRFVLSSYSVAETAGSLTGVSVFLNKLSAITVTVDVRSSNGTASSASDYAPISTTLIIPPFNSGLSFNVPITDDLIYETGETFTLTLSNPISAVLGMTNNPVPVTITDNETQPTVRFSASAYSVNENAGPATITVALSHASAFTAMVNLATSSGAGVGQAAAGSDYTAVNTALTFAPGVITWTFPITITNDTVYEGNEGLTLLLSSPVSTSIAGTNPAPLTIVDNESPPTLQLSASTYSVEEYGGAVVVTATLAGATAVTATVNYAASNGTAASGSDFSLTPGTLTFPPGATTRSFSVSIVNDATYEGNETFNLTLGSAVSATVVSPSSAVVTIFDNDPRPGCTIFNKTESPPLDIPDDKPTGIDSVLVIPGPGVVITDVSVRIDQLMHTFVGDLNISLLAPTGATVLIVNRIGDPQVADKDNFIHTVLNDSYPTPIANGPAPFTGNFEPYNSLSSFNGLTSGGTWRLNISDNASGDSGTLDAWGLEICGGATAPITYLYLPLVQR